MDKLNIDGDLAEQHFGDWQGLTYVEIAEKHGDNHLFWLAPPEQRPPGGESFVDLRDRTVKSIDRLTEEHRGRDIVATAHGGTIRAALAHAFDLHPEAAVRFEIDNVSITLIEHFEQADPDHAWRVAFVNYMPRELVVAKASVARMKSKAELAAEQAAFWNGPGGQGWLATYHQRIERSIADLGQDVLAAAAAKPGEHVIDIGCGMGGTTADLARAVGPTGHVLGVDISEPLIEAARSHRVDNATFVVGDAVTYPFKAAAYDLVFSRFGVMFFGDPVAAFQNLRHALKPTGRLVFLCWRTPQENPWGLVPLRAAQPFLPPMPRPGPEDPGQYSFGDRARGRAHPEGGGLRHARHQAARPADLDGKNAAEVAQDTGRFGPLARAFADAGPAAVEKAKAAIAEVLASHQGPDGVMLPGACWLVSAGKG